jgi:hypothetical protein
VPSKPVEVVVSRSLDDRGDLVEEAALSSKVNLFGEQVLRVLEGCLLESRSV